MHQINLTETRRQDRTKELNFQIKADFRTFIRLNHGSIRRFKGRCSYHLPLQQYLNRCSKKNLKKNLHLFADYQKSFTFAADIKTNGMKTILVNAYWWRFLQLIKS